MFSGLKNPSTLFGVRPKYILKKVLTLGKDYRGTDRIVEENIAQKVNVIIGSSFLWKDRYRVGLHSFSEFFLKKGYSVHFLTVLFSLLLVINPWYPKSKLRRLYVWFKKGEKHNFNKNRLVNYVFLSLFHPSAVIPLLDSYFVAKNYLKFSYPPIARLLREVNPVDILFFYTGGVSIYSQIPAKLVVYRLNDMLAGFGKVPEGLIKYESEILRKVDLILPVSEPLYEYAVRKRGTREGIYLLPNGVNIEKFSRLYPVPLEYKKIPKPRVIYVGVTDFWFDWDLLSYAATQKKNVSFVIVGPGHTASNLPKNVYTFGLKRYEDIPAYMQHADIGLIPFKDIPIIQYVERPLKFYEYLASGLPVVSVSYGALKKMAPYAILADSPEEFVEGIERALRFGKTERNKLREVAKKFSWEKVFEEFDKILSLYGY